VRWLALALALFVAAGAHAQEAAKKKKPVAKKQQPAGKPAAGKPAAHAKPTPEQIRRFNELQKKKQQ